MKVLLVGATGNLGIRLVPALLSHGHKVTAFVRSRSKLETMLPSATFDMITVTEGDAKDPAAIKSAISTGSDAVVSTAGLAAPTTWHTSDFPVIFKAIVDGTLDAAKESGKSVRLWMLGGMTAVNYPGTDNMIMN